MYPAEGDPLVTTLKVSFDDVEQRQQQLHDRLFYIGAWALRECTPHRLINELIPTHRPCGTWTVWSWHLDDPDTQPDQLLRLQSLSLMCAAGENDNLAAPPGYPLVVPSFYEQRIRDELARDCGIPVPRALCLALELGLSASLFSIAMRDLERAGVLAIFQDGSWTRLDTQEPC
jgi:hypothetical protein